MLQTEKEEGRAAAWLRLGLARGRRGPAAPGRHGAAWQSHPGVPGAVTAVHGYRCRQLRGLAAQAHLLPSPLWGSPQWLPSALYRRHTQLPLANWTSKDVILRSLTAAGAALTHTQGFIRLGASGDRAQGRRTCMKAFGNCACTASFLPRPPRRPRGLACLHQVPVVLCIL